MRGTPGIRLLTLVLLSLPVLAACDRDGELRDPDLLARAGDFELTVEEAAEMLAPEVDIPGDPQVLQALSDFWADYTLLAWVVNREGELDRLSLDPLVRQQTEQELVMRLRDHVIDTDPQVTDEELRTFFEEEGPGEEVRARHILLLYPDQATEAQRDSVRALAEELRDRARAGGDFEAMAREYSDDPGSAPRGGDLGYFDRGTMVGPFEEAAFALEPGEVSDVVETQFGLHVIRSEDRRRADFDEMADQLRDELKATRTMQAESIFVADLEERAEIRIDDDVAERIREITRRADYPLSGRAARQALVRFQGGSFTAEDYRQFLLTQDRGIRDQILGAPDEQLQDFLMNLARSRLLVEEARRQGIEVPSGEMDELRREIRREYRSTAEHLGIIGITPREGESLRDAVDREAKELLARLITGEQEMIPLQTLAVPLRVHYGVRISEPGIERAGERILALRDGEATEAPEPTAEDPFTTP